MKKDIIIEVYKENNVVIVKDLNKNSVQIETNFDELTIESCIYFLKNFSKNA